MEAATDIDRRVLFASLLMSVNIKSFVRAGNLIPGGFTGLSLLLQRTAETFFGISLPYSVINIALNAIPGDHRFSDDRKKFTSYTVLMIVLNSFLVDLIPVTPITYDPLLVSVFGGILNGTQSRLLCSEKLPAVERILLRFIFPPDCINRPGILFLVSMW